MNFLIIFLMVTQVRSVPPNIRTPGAKIDTILKYTFKGEYDKALALNPPDSLSGKIMILKGDFGNGFEKIKKSALKGNVLDCVLFVLSKMDVKKDDIAAFIRVEMDMDTTINTDSPYIQYLSGKLMEEKDSVMKADTVLYPFVLFNKGFRELEESPVDSKKYLSELLSSYPNSIPAIIARNILRLTEK